MNSWAERVQYLPKVPGVRCFVSKGDLIICQFQETIIADCHTEDVGSQILERRHTAVFPVSDALYRKVT